jgi:hypothetical protein
MQMDNHEIELPAEDTTGAGQVLGTAFAFWRAALLLSADELGLFTALASGAMDAPTVAARIGIGAEAAADLLEALGLLGFVEQRCDGYHPTPVAARFLDPDRPTYLGRWLIMARATMRDTADLTRRLRASGAKTANGTPPVAGMWADIAAILETDRV